MLVVLFSSLIAAIAGAGVVMAQDADPVRALPAQVMPGDQFDVTVTFTSPAADLNSIGLTDTAPAGWTVTVDTAWTTPTVMTAHTPTPDQAAYIWSGPHASGVTFTVVYRVQVPPGATPGTYTFAAGQLEYYIAAGGPYVEAITGDAQIEVMSDPSVIPPPVGGSAAPANKLLIVLPWIGLAAVLAGAGTLVLKRRRSET